jgi:hypothetical protein
VVDELCGGVGVALLVVVEARWLGFLMFMLLLRFGPKPRFLRRLLIDSIGREQSEGRKKVSCNEGRVDEAEESWVELF